MLSQYSFDYPVIASEDKIKKLNLSPLARIVAYADAELDPVDFSIAPHQATKKVLARAGMSLGQIDYF